MAPTHDVEMPRLGDGTTYFEICVMGFHSAFGVASANVLSHLCYNRGYVSERARFIAEFIGFILPHIAMLTIAADYHFLTMAAIGLPCLFYWYLDKRPTYYPVATEQYYSNFRCLLHIITAIAILGVDFPVFDRRYAKTRTYGFSPMDLGTAFFVLSMGYGSGLYHKSFRQYKLAKNFKIGGMIGALGVARAAFVHFSGVPYHSEVTEYGVYWNFFFTLGLLKLLTPFIFPGVGIVAVALAQYADNHLDVLIREDRDLNNFFDSNREGLISIAGYVALLDFGYLYARIYRKLQGKTPSTFKGFWINFAVLFITYPLYVYSESIGHPPCRRFANPAYVMMCTFFFNGCITILSFDDMIFLHRRIPASLTTAIGDNSLVVFLLGNVLTGLINLSMNTEKVTNSMVSMAVLIGYAFVVCFAAFVLRPAPRVVKKD